MKKLLLIFYVIMLASCANNNSSSPSGAMQSFFDAAKKGNIEALKEHITSQDLAMLKMGESFMKNLDSSSQQTMQDKIAGEFKNKIGNGTIIITDEKIDGDKATLNVQYSLDEKQLKQEFLLQKENGAWKVALMASGMKSSNTSEAELKEGMKQLNEGLNNLGGLKDSIGQVMKDFKNLNRDSLKKIMGANKDGINKVMKQLNISKDSLEKMVQMQP